MGGLGYPACLVNELETLVQTYQKPYRRAIYNTLSQGKNMGCCKKYDDPRLKTVMLLWVAAKLKDPMGDDLKSLDDFGDT